MIRASYSDKALVVDILTNAFDNNKSVNYIIKQDKKRKERIRELMSYSFEMCYHFGKVMLSDDKKGCGLIVLTERKKTSLRSLYLDLKLILFCVGLRNIKKVLSRESTIKKLQDKKSTYYLWFIGVLTSEQNKGIGSTLLSDLIKDASLENRTICLETSTLKNIPWYKKFGFKIYNELDIGYRLFFMKN